MRSSRSWLENNGDLLQLFMRDLQLYVAPKDFNLPSDITDMRPWRDESVGHRELQHSFTFDGDIMSVKPPLRQQYKQIFNRLKMTVVDLSTRRDVLRDIYRELSEHPGERTTDDLLEELCNRYEAQGLIRSKTMLRQVWQMGFRQRTFDYQGEVASVHVPVWLTDEIDSEATFVHRAEAGFVYAVINAGLEIDKGELAAILLNDPDQTDYIQSLLDDLEERALILEQDGRYILPGNQSVPFAVNSRCSRSAMILSRSNSLITYHARLKRRGPWQRPRCYSAHKILQRRPEAISMPAGCNGKP